MMFPLFMQDPFVEQVMREAIAAIPKGTNIYLTGGALRNAIYYDVFRETLPQRDYDLLVVGDVRTYVANLRKKGYTYGKIRRKYDIVVKKKRVPKPTDWHRDHVFLDLHVEPAFRNVNENLRTRTNFTINQFMIPLRDTISTSWKKKVLTIPGALDDLKHKQLRLTGNTHRHPGDLFACIRFMSKGFKPPSRQEVNELLNAFARFEKWRYPRNVKKLFSYVGGEQNARKLARRLGMKQDLFTYATVQKLRQGRLP